jgi:hypothetical protein
VAGCATPGPLHVYGLAATGAERTVVDTDEGRTVDVPAFLEEDDEVTGFAYDPYTDHFFLRLNPGNRMRVVDRPARAIKRQYDLEGITDSGGDLALRPRDGHLYLLAGKDVVETNRFGKHVRTFALAGIPDAPIGIALDLANDRLLVLAHDGRTITTHDLQGGKQSTFQLAEAAGNSLAFDSEKRELYAPLRARPGMMGIFDQHGALVRTLALTGSFVDVGPRSFVRVF